MAKVALITGITGQDGSYLAEFLLEKGYEVHGITRRASISNTARIDHLMGKITLHDGDLSDSSSLIRIISLVNPDEIYNLAAQSHVQVSFDVPEYSGDVDALGVLRILEACRILGLTKKTKVYQASTSELYGKVEEVPQKETTPFHPYSPYAVAKQYGFWIVKEYREAYGMFAVNGILFNHESERRGENFVTRKITLAAGRIAEGLQDHLELGNMDSLRDWGYAKDYVECMWMIMQHETPEDFVIATGEQHTVRDFTEKAFAANGIKIRWEGKGLDEKGYDAETGKMFKLDFDPRVIGNKILPDGTKKTGIGNFIRVTSLDEFPQFFNVLKGDMSIVGTRPPLPGEVSEYELHHRARLAIKPGITGMWQVSGRSDITDFEEVVRLDTKYIKEWSPALDIKILFKTVKTVLGKEGSM